MLSRRAFFGALFSSLVIAPMSRMTTLRVCPMCGRAVVRAESTAADVTGPANISRVYVPLAQIYWHQDGSRCHRQLRKVVPV